MKNQSFTLIELLVVIAIVGILAGIIIVSMTNATNSADDTRRKADVNQIVNSLQIYSTSNSNFPIVSTPCNIGNNCPASVNTALNNSANAKDPKSGSYYTYWSDGNSFIITSILSNGSLYSYDSSNSKYGQAIYSGEWIDTGLGFQVMKYEARNINGFAYSTPTGTPWTNITQNQAIAACNKIGARLITVNERTALARHVASQAINWSSGVVGTGFLSRGYSGASALDGFSNTQVAPNSEDSSLYNTAANTVGSSGVFKLKRTHNLANNKVIWDLAGNVYEWGDETCTQGTGNGNWYNIGSWVEWNNANLTDYEIVRSGPNPIYTSTNNAGQYIGCSASGNALIYGGLWSDSANVGIFTLALTIPPTGTYSYVGFRCAK